MVNGEEILTREDLDLITGPPLDDRDFIQTTFRGLYFEDDDHRFLDSAWSHVDRMSGPKRDLAVAALCLAAARKQPRGVFTVTSLRYDDGRRQLRMPLRELFVEAVADYNAAVFDGEGTAEARCGDGFEIEPGEYDLVYLDPPYAPPRDDNCYIKRYHFLEGLATYWRGQEILYETKTRKIKKRFTPFSYKRTIRGALESLFDQFSESSIVLSYGSNSVPEIEEIHQMLISRGREVEVRTATHQYSFGTHRSAKRRSATEYIVLAR